MNDRRDGNLKAHQAALEKSPVFKAMCKGPFQESQELLIRLPEDDYDEVAWLIQYLYSGVLDLGSLDMSACPGTYASHRRKNNVVAGLYLLADKYQVEGLKIVAAGRLIELFWEHDSCHAFQCLIDVARLIYGKTGPSDQVFRKQFRAAMTKSFKAGNALSEVMRGILLAGGEIAVDIFEAQRVAMPHSST